MNEDTRIVVGEKFEDVKERAGRTLTVLAVNRQQRAAGRFKTGHVYATCHTSTGVKVRIDVRRLLSWAYRPLPAPAPAAAADSCPTPPAPAAASGA